jgi:hypothetical protein
MMCFIISHHRVNIQTRGKRNTKKRGKLKKRAGRKYEIQWNRKNVYFHSEFLLCFNNANKKKLHKLMPKNSPAKYWFSLAENSVWVCRWVRVGLSVLVGAAERGKNRRTFQCFKCFRWRSMWGKFSSLSIYLYNDHNFSLLPQFSTCKNTAS